MPTHRFAGVLLVDGMSFQDDLQIGRTRSMFRLIVLVEGEEGSCTLISITRKKIRQVGILHCSKDCSFSSLKLAFGRGWSWMYQLFQVV